MKHTLPLAVLLLLAPPVFAADPASSCLEEQIKIQDLTLDNTQLTQQLMQSQSQLAQQMQQMLPSLQTQFQTAQRANETARKERQRLEGLRVSPGPMPTEEKK